MDLQVVEEGRARPEDGGEVLRLADGLAADLFETSRYGSFFEGPKDRCNFRKVQLDRRLAGELIVFKQTKVTHR